MKATMSATHWILCQLPKKITIAHDLRQKLRLTSHQCDQKWSVGDQNFITGCQHVTKLLSPRHLKFQGKRAFFETKHKAPMHNCSKTKHQFYNCHIYPVPYRFSSFSHYRYCGQKHDVAITMSRVKIESFGWNTCLMAIF